MGANSLALRPVSAWSTVSEPIKKGLYSLFIAGLLAGPRAWRDRWWHKRRAAMCWNWLEVDRPLYGPQWFERPILDKASQRLPTAKGDDRIFLLQLIMQHAYAYEGDWHRELIAEALNGHIEFLHYLFKFPHFIDSLQRQDRIIGFIERLYADLDALHDQPLEPKLRAEIASQIAQNFSFMPALFSEANLRPMAQAAGRWVDTYLRLQGHQLDYEFPSAAPGTRLRVGIYVHDIEPRNESFISVPFGLGLDRARFETVLVTGRPPSDCAFGALVKKAFERIEVIAGERIEDRVASVRALNLDFLILGNSIVAQATEAQRFLSHRLARRQILPVAISPSTTGLKAIDYVLTAPNTEDKDKAQQHYTEKLHWLEGTFNCFSFGPRDPRLVEDVEVRAPRKPIVFASGGVIYKLGPALRQSFIRILRSVPDSELLLYPFNPNWSLNPKALTLKQALLAQFTDAGIDPDRIQILPAMTPAQILKLMGQVSVYLDTFPFSGGASVMEPIFAACPIVTLRGRMQRGLLGTGMMRALGLDEFVANDVAEYEAKAIEIARSPERRAALSERLRQAAEQAPFLNPALFGERLGVALDQLAALPLPSSAASGVVPHIAERRDASISSH